MNFDALKDKDKFYVYPNIPRDKAQNAINAYCGGVDYEDVLIVLDETVFGSCKSGSVLTINSIFFKEDFETAKAFSLSEVSSCYAKKGLLGCGIYINDKKVLGITQASYSDVVNFCEYVMQVVHFCGDSEEEYEEVITLKKYQNDKLFQTIKDTESSFLKSVFSINSFGGSLGLKVKHYVWPMLCFIRSNYIDKKRAIFLQNNIASLEIIIGLLSLLSARLRSMGIRENIVLHVLKEGVRGVLDSNDMSQMAEIAFDNSDDDDYQIIIVGMMCRLLISNLRGKACVDLDEDNMKILFAFIASNNGSAMRNASSEEELVQTLFVDVHRYFTKNVGLSIEDQNFMNKVYGAVDNCAQEVLRDLKEQYGGF